MNDFLPLPILVALIAFAAAIIGGVLQATLTSGRERRSFRWAQNRANYEQFLASVAGKAVNPVGSPERKVFEQMGLEATARILLQGLSRVVEALISYQTHGVFSTEESFADFRLLTEEMRYDVGGEKMKDFPAAVRSILFEDKQ